MLTRQFAWMLTGRPSLNVFLSMLILLVGGQNPLSELILLGRRFCAALGLIFGAFWRVALDRQVTVNGKW